MQLKTILALTITATMLFSCNASEEKGTFTLKGDLKNIPDQQVYLEQLFFSQQDPQVLDTGNVKAGKFELSSVANEEGLYRIRFEKMGSGFIFINDKPGIQFSADMNNVSLEGPVFNSPANAALKGLLIDIEAERIKAMAANALIDSLQKNKASDSALTAAGLQFRELHQKFSNYILKYVDSSKYPVVTMMALGYTDGIDPALLKPIVANLNKRFPNHKGIEGIVTQFNAMLQQANQPQQPTTGAAVGTMAPDFTMNDTEGKPFTMSSLKGKYVLIDFWASWCGPCRGENPNVVSAYNKFKDKNFTILGVSLDDNKEAWLKAIKTDGLLWKQVSDLKKWENATISLYGYDAIPYNVLLDPQGKIIASNLREAALHNKLAEVLK
ncbi:MAG TPA: TlpA disulfide reductase family protein [Ferruginibacter sp.]|nr:TlpA disulfide reductase family protein [Ferruginibacter sp.]HRE64175.1 TlpA disulfide reductase family protein [Ferruginibacter sp.]